MLRFLSGRLRLCDGITRREVLRVGGLGAFLLSAGEPFRLPGAVAEDALPSSGRARSVVFITLYGGPPQTETFDMKPQGPSEARPVSPIATSVPGIEICEYLPHLAQVAHLGTVVRSLTHSDTAHAAALYTYLTGWPHPLLNTNSPATPDDHPHLGAAMGVLRPSPGSVPPCLIVGGRILPQFQGIGQTGGYLGAAHEPLTVDRDAQDPDSILKLMTLRDEVPTFRLDHRRRLLGTLEAGVRNLDVDRKHANLSAIQQSAYQMLSSRELVAAFDLEREPERVRDRYGRFALGQNLLLARRLVEAGVPTIQVSDIPPGGEQHWDLHYGNIFSRLRESLLPHLDQSVAAFLADLRERGLLEQTLVIVGGEFGRTPWMDRAPDQGGRQHWPRCYSALLAGGGIRQGEVFGSSDQAAAYPASNPVAPWDLGATILHLAGIDPAGEISDRHGRPRPLCRGHVMHDVLV